MKQSPGFDSLCRRNGIVQRFTCDKSATGTGRIPHAVPAGGVLQDLASGERVKERF
jgi:hypothetical protein